MKRFAALLLLSLGSAFPIFARVVSYAPYTSRFALTAHQDRAARHFVLIESELPSFHINPPAGEELVLYDSAGLSEPRVITPGGDRIYFAAALFEKADGSPVILAIGKSGTAPFECTTCTVVSVSDGGERWNDVQGLGAFRQPLSLEFDSGGRFTHGMLAPIVIGNETWPFIVTLPENGVWAFGPSGARKRVFAGAAARVMGRNAAGDQFLIQSDGAIWRTSVDGPAVRLARRGGSGIAGWITADGTTYVTFDRRFFLGHFLATIANGELQFIVGPTSDQALIAVPTYDYEGAWLLQSDPVGTRATLSRHTRASGLEVQWTNAPVGFIASLIPGRSGSSLLIEQSRGRPSLSNFANGGPAIAVWRLGQRAPREFHELHLEIDGPSGFVHVDVEEIEGGKPFVFDSGFRHIEGGRRRCRAGVGCGPRVSETTLAAAGRGTSAGCVRILLADRSHDLQPARSSTAGGGAIRAPRSAAAGRDHRTGDSDARAA